MNPDVRERLLQATYDCVARWGLAKTTIEDAAREAGVSRATVYRYFPGGRDELLSAVVGWEFSRFFLRLYEEVSEDARMVVSEPLGDIPGVWNEVPEATCRIVGQGHDEQRPFRPTAP